MPKKALLVLAAVALVAALPAGGQNPALNGEAQLGWVATVVPPEITCAGGLPTGLPFPQCSEGTRHILGRNEVQTWWPFVLAPQLEPLLTGAITFVVNCNFDAQYRGPCWGTFTWDVPGVGQWAGSWTAPVMDLLTYESRISMVGHGAGGEIAGRQMKFDGGSAPYEWFVSGNVRIH